MIRLTLLFLAGMALAGCMSREAIKEMQAKHQARIEAAKIPAVQLNTQQLVKVKAVSPRGDIAWLRAGQQKDGKIFVCHVTRGKTLFGGTSIGVWSGTLEADGEYHRSPAYLVSPQAIMEDCYSRGFEPPVTIKTTVTTVRY